MVNNHIEVAGITKKELILSLIKADMRNIKLIKGLDKAGALVEYFHSDLGTIILKLIGFEEVERDDTLYDFYDKTLNRIIDIDVSEFMEQLNFLTVDFYNELLCVRIERHEKKESSSL